MHVPTIASVIGVVHCWARAPSVSLDQLPVKGVWSKLCEATVAILKVTNICSEEKESVKYMYKDTETMSYYR